MICPRCKQPLAPVERSHRVEYEGKIVSACTLCWSVMACPEPPKDDGAVAVGMVEVEVTTEMSEEDTRPMKIPGGVKVEIDENGEDIIVD